jgi:hypothetical protein
MQPPRPPAPVTWEEAQPVASAAQSSTPAASSMDVANTKETATTPDEISDAHESSPSPKATTRAAARKKSEKSDKKSAAQNHADEIAADKTVHLAQAARVTKSGQKQTPVSAAVVTTDKASVQVALEHSFDQAQVTVWVGDQQVLSDTIRGEKKRVLMFQRTHGTFMNKVSVPAGPHLVRVRIQSPSDSFDASQSVNGDFAKSKDYVLHARCDKKRKELKLDLEPVTLTSSAEGR